MTVAVLSDRRLSFKNGYSRLTFPHSVLHPRRGPPHKGLKPLNLAPSIDTFIRAVLGTLPGFRAYLSRTSFLCNIFYKSSSLAAAHSFRNSFKLEQNMRPILSTSAFGADDRGERRLNVNRNTSETLDAHLRDKHTRDTYYPSLYPIPKSLPAVKAFSAPDKKAEESKRVRSNRKS